MRITVARSVAVALAVALSAGSAAAIADDELPEIVVTAQKKAERLQDVGISITALTPQDIQNGGVTVAQDIVKLVPSLQYNAFTPGAVVFNIRGVSQNDFGDQQEPPIAVYYDDSYASSLNLSSFPVFDLQRVEVLRGPQGTLFGRNATGGAIQYITNKPTTDFEGYVTATAGSYSQWNFEGAISGPLTSGVQDRFAFERAENHGPYLDIYDGTRRGGQDNYALRNELAAQFSDNVSGLLTLRYARNNHENNAGVYSWVGDYPGPHGLGYYATPTTPSPFGTCTGCDLSGYSNYGIDPRFGGDPWKVAMNSPSEFDRTLRGASLRLEANGSGLDWVLIADYLNMSKRDLEDGDGGPNTSFITDLRSQIDQYTVEARVSAKSGINDWTAGLFYMNIDGHFSSYANFASFGNYVTNGLWQQTTASAAVFGQDQIKITDQWSLILGARYWHDDRKFNNQVSDNFGSVFNFNPTTYPGLADRTFSTYTAKVELDRKFGDKTLGYLSWNRGSKSGGFTFQFFPPADTTPEGLLAYAKTLTYDPEILDSYELGTKTRLLNDTLSINADIFYYDYKSYQAYVLYGPNVTIKNLKAKEHGAELEIISRPIRNLTLSAGVSALRSEVYNVVLGDGTVVQSALPQAPTWSGHGSVQYDLPLPSGATLSAYWLTSYIGHSYFTVLAAPIDYEAGYATSQARLTYRSSSDKWDAAIFVNNAFNKVYRVFNSDTNFIGVAESIYAPPQWFGITGTVRFGGRH